MTRTRTTLTVAAAVLAIATLARGEEPKGKDGGKKLVSCSQIVETYKKNQSVDETSDALFVDQSVVAACLKAAGITPNELDR